MATLAKAPTGIIGFDALTVGGLPAGRPTLVCGGPGCGKTMFAAAFLVQGAVKYDEPGVFVSFEERRSELESNVASLGYDFGALIAQNKLVVDNVDLGGGTIEENGDYDLEGLFLRIGYAVDSIGAKRLVLDTVETLYAGFNNPALLRNELRRLFGWIKSRNLTAVITGESGGDGQLTRHGLEEYVSDCVIFLDNRVRDHITTRRLRVVKYRGSPHGANEYPFLMDEKGITVLPSTSAEARSGLSSASVSTGVAGLDAMLEKGGLQRGSSVLLSGNVGTGKTVIACQFAEAACARGERCQYFGFEEGGEQIRRNALSIGIDLGQRIEGGLLRFEGARPSQYGLEMHLARMYRELDAFQPDVVVVDPISAFRGGSNEVYVTLLRMVDMLKSLGITTLFTALDAMEMFGGTPSQELVSRMDAWLRLRDVETDGERNHIVQIMKCRGMNHSNQWREYRITDTGVELLDPAGQGVLTGAARLTDEALGRVAAMDRRQEVDARRRDLAARRDALEFQLANVRAALATSQVEEKDFIERSAAREAALTAGEIAVAARRGAHW